MPLLDDLNPVQQTAVKATDGPVLVLAGAGSGKTRVLTYKVSYLIAEKKIAPENILVLTFTNKAGGEMKERIFKLIGRTGSQPLMGTFHSVCAKFLRKEGYLLGLKPGFSIYDEGDALDAVKEAMSNLKIPIQKTNPSSARHTISSAKNELLSSTEYPQYAKGYFQETVAKIYIEYQNILRRNQALDFDDLLMETIRLFQKEPQTLQKYQIQFKYILVDEYQDTNAAQYQLIKLLSQRYKNLCVVGDAAQSIYAFRGADFRNIVNFNKDYPNAKTFNLEQNYRSTQVILDAAHSVIMANKTHPILKLWTDKKSGPKVTVFEARTEVDEALFIVEKATEAVKLGAQLSDFAVLYRTNAQSRTLEEVFLKNGLPYRLFGGVQFYERKEIKDVLAYLKIVGNPQDSISKKRIEKIGKGRAERFYSFLEEISGGEGKEPINYSTLNLLDIILQKTGYLAYLEDGTEQGKLRIENVKELRSVAEEFPEIVKFLENVALIQDNQMPDSQLKNSERESVSLLTIHASKGLEFPIVFLIGMEEGLFPHSRSMLDSSQMEEERRLAYVGITRAKKQVFFTYARSRLYFGTRSNNLVSRFLGDIPQNLIESSSDYRSEKDSSALHFDEDVSKDTDDWLNG